MRRRKTSPATKAKENRGKKQRRTKRISEITRKKKRTARDPKEASTDDCEQYDPGPGEVAQATHQDRQGWTERKQGGDEETATGDDD